MDNAYHCPSFSFLFSRTSSTSSSRAGKLDDLLVALEQLWLRLEEAVDNSLHKLPRLVLELLLGRAEDLLKDADEFGCETLYSRLVGFV